jgi:hypothetical protein
MMRLGPTLNAAKTLLKEVRDTLNRSLQTLLEVKRTCRARRACVDPTRLTLLYGPTARCKPK